MTLTKRQQDIITYITDYQIKHNFSPTHGEIGNGLGITRQAVDLHIKRLILKGVLIEEMKPRRPIKIVWDMLNG